MCVSRCSLIYVCICMHALLKGIPIKNASYYIHRMKLVMNHDSDSQLGLTEKFIGHDRKDIAIPGHWVGSSLDKVHRYTFTWTFIFPTTQCDNNQTTCSQQMIHHTIITVFCTLAHIHSAILINVTISILS